MSIKEQILAIACDPTAANEEFSDRRSAFQAGHDAALQAVAHHLAQLDVVQLAQMIDFVARARRESDLIETPTGPRVSVPYWFMRDPKGVEAPSTPSGQAQVSLAQWNDAYSAFSGAFDTPLARRRDDSEYA